MQRASCEWRKWWEQGSGAFGRHACDLCRACNKACVWLASSTQGYLNIGWSVAEANQIKFLAAAIYDSQARINIGSRWVF
ncbi:MAG: hypothetical protein A3F91_03695 [Flavobacteria bacterium RIFCSPLOWO2_12_FULL_35_11]|nr:MAG: hypothetical protein A3F91_03695 [Flavobacteria bacterium RIFCSPLOWO2_12_FULL_35_11]